MKNTIAEEWERAIESYGFKIASGRHQMPETGEERYIVLLNATSRDNPYAQVEDMEFLGMIPLHIDRIPVTARVYDRDGRQIYARATLD